MVENIDKVQFVLAPPECMHPGFAYLIIFPMNDSLRQGQYKDAGNLNARIALHDRFSTNPEDMMHWSLDQVELGDEARILEVGCGPGNLWRENAGRIPAEWQMVLTDFSEGMVSTARETLGEAQYVYACVNAEEIPFPENTFDAVFAHFMLYHVPDRIKAIGEMRRVLKPGGRVYAATIGMQHMPEIYELINEFLDGRDWVENRIQQLPFLLETGGTQLETSFEDMRLRLFKDDLAVTDADLLLAYMQSLMLPQQEKVRGEWAEGLRAFLQAEIERDGVIRISKSAGMFVAG